jgi:signal transduction histidine kinase
VRRWFRPTVRLRLTLLYAGLLALCGAGLLTIDLAIVGDTAGRSISAAGVNSPETARVNASLYVTRAQLVNQLTRVSLAGFAVTVLASLGGGWVIAGRALRPVREITAAARRASEHDLRQRVALAGPHDELRELADTLDDLLARLDASFEAQRRFAANASHEVRTPLSIVRTSVEVGLASPRADLGRYRRMALEARDGVDRAERLLDGLQLLARTERAARALEPVDLADAARDALATGAAELDARGLRLTTVLRAAPVRGVRPLLDRMVANLVENAVRHNQPGGALEVATGVAGRRAFVQVRNDGVSIPLDAVSRLFEPFRRLDGDRTGSERGAGLGLSIVRSVATSHAGDVEARPRTTGGLEVVVTLPAAP